MYIKGLINESETKIKYFTGSDLTRENYHCGNLYLQLRKYTREANRDENIFYCSRCGELLNTAQERRIHVMEDHDQRF